MYCNLLRSPGSIVDEDKEQDPNQVFITIKALLIKWCQKWDLADINSGKGLRVRTREGEIKVCFKEKKYEKDLEMRERSICSRNLKSDKNVF